MILLSESPAYINVSIAQGIVSRYMGEDKSNESYKSDITGNSGSSDISAQTNESVKADVPPLSYESISGLMQSIDRISDSGKSGQDAVQAYKFAYALRLYFTIVLHREMLMSIEHQNFAHFRKFTGCEIWSPDYRRFTDYPLFGRFSVSYPVYLKLKSSMANDETSALRFKESELNSACYLNIRGKTYFIDRNNTNVRKTLFKLSDGHPCDAEIIFDIAFVMLNEVTTESSYQDVNLGHLNTLNDMLLVLLNWDVCHYVEKNMQEALEERLGSRLRLREPDREIKWYTRFCSSVLSVVGPLSRYLRSTDEDDFYFDVNNLSQFQRVFYANAEVQKAYVKHILSSTRTILDSPAAGITDLPKDFNQVLHICTDILPAVRRTWLPQLDNIRYFSVNIDRIMKEFDTLYNAFSELLSLLQTERGESHSVDISRRAIVSSISKSEKIKSYLDEHSSELMAAYNKWYEKIIDKCLEANIIKDITQSFRLAVSANKRDGDK